MALAAYGDPDRYYKELRDLVVLGEHGAVHVAPPWGTYDTTTPLLLDDLTWSPPQAADQPFTLRADLAAAAQRVFSDAVVHVARHLRHVTTADTLVFSGGCALNSA